MQVKKPVILTEFPKSGGSWIVSMIGDVLNIPQRDIYVRPGFDLFDIKKHPWYLGVNELDFPEQSVIKSHELFGSSLIDFDATYIHLIRDGRDVVVSKWFFEKEFLTKNGISPSFNEDFEKYVEKTAYDWSNYVENWAGKSTLTIQYENFLLNPVQSLSRVVQVITNDEFSIRHLENTISKFTKNKFSDSLSQIFKHNTFVRKGVAGDWRNYFSATNVEVFKSRAGETLLSMGYELDSDWNL